MLNGNYAVVISAIFFHFYILPTAISLCADGYVGLPVTSSPVHVFVSSSPLTDKERPVLLLLQKKKMTGAVAFFPHVFQFGNHRLLATVDFITSHGGLET